MVATKWIRGCNSLAFLPKVCLAVGLFLGALQFISHRNDVARLLSKTAQVFPAETVLFRKSGFLTTHDAATGYIKHGSIWAPVAQTQTIPLESQLNCGARALDFRIVAQSDGLHYHHSEIHLKRLVGWKSKETVELTLPRVVDWARRHFAEMVIILLSHCLELKWSPVLGYTEVPCNSSFITSVFERAGARVQFSCGAVKAWTRDDAFTYSQMEGGGHVLVLPNEDDCVDVYYDSKVNHIPELLPYVQKTMAASHTKNMPFMVQSLLQQRGPRVPLDTRVNDMVFSWLRRSHLYAGVNFLEINLICSHGPSIAATLGAKVSENDAAQCKTDCQWACEHFGACEQTYLIK